VRRGRARLTPAAPPRFPDREVELEYCLRRFLYREERQCLTSFVSPHSRTREAQLRDWKNEDPEGFALWERATRAVESRPTRTQPKVGP
jgi:hypothetical protein